MKYSLIIIFLISLTIEAKADLPYMPFEISLSSDKNEYIEGEIISLKVSIKNNDTKKSYPLLLPNTQNSGNKIVYLRATDPAENFFILRAEESRAINMNIKYLSAYSIDTLAPGQVYEYKIFLNDWQNYLTKIESHHRLNYPLFAGVYNFQVFYNPFQTGNGDSLYNCMNDTDQEQSKTKINFLGSLLSMPLKIKLIKNTAENINIDGVNYICKSDQNISFTYYKNQVSDSNKVHVLNIMDSKSNVYLDVRYENNKIIQWLGRYQNGLIMTYSLRDINRCPDEYFSRTFDYTNNKILALQTDTLSDGTTKTLIYNGDMTISKEILISKGGYKTTFIDYIYENGVLVDKNEKIVETDSPCESIIENLDNPK